MKNFEGTHCAHQLEHSFGQESEPFNVFINRGNRPKSIFDTWDFEIRVSRPKGNDSFIYGQNDYGACCDCKECINFGPELLDYFALHDAMEWFEKNSRKNIEINVFADSKALLAASYDGFIAYGGRYKCPVLITLEKDLNRWARLFNIKVFLLPTSE